jgi:hypothetical protein
MSNSESGIFDSALFYKAKKTKKNKCSYDHPVDG